MNSLYWIVLVLGFVFTVLWLVGVVLMCFGFVWALFVADPAWMAPGSLNRDSTVPQKVAALGLLTFFVAFGIAWLAIIRYLWQRTS